MITFHKILRGCEEGSAESWQSFLADYTPIVFRLIDVYLPNLAPVRSEFWLSIVQMLKADGSERLRRFDHQAEREFLLDLRAFLFEQGGERLDRALDAADAPTPDVVRALLRDLPLLDQQILLTKLAGYSDATAEKIYTITPTAAQQGMKRLQGEYLKLLNRDDDVCLWPAAWSSVVGSARASRADLCPQLRQYVRMLDGQINWYDKEPLERHLGACFHCLEGWTALREVVHWRREAKPCPSEEVSRLLSGLQFQPESRSRKPLLKRVFGC